METPLTGGRWKQLENGALERIDETPAQPAPPVPDPPADDPETPDED